VVRNDKSVSLWTPKAGPGAWWCTRLRILITAQYDSASQELLAPYGQIIYEGFGERMRLLAGKRLVERLRGVDVFITEVDQLRSPVLAQTDSLQVVASCRGDPVNIDLDECTARGIPVLYAPGRNAAAVAELTLSFMLMLNRRILPAMRLLREGAGDLSTMARAFFDFKGNELWEKTVGLVGFGAVGQAVAVRLQPFGSHVIAFDPYGAAERAGAMDVELVHLDQLLRESDFVSLHAAVTPETRGMIGVNQLAMMKANAYFINTARAALVDEEALALALREKRIAGAAIDVFGQESPPSDHPLLQLDNVIATPHMAGNTAEVVVHQSRLITDDVIALFEGRPPHHVANPQVLKSFRWR
jgi:phosphoglycerate dehydrogenase-like enzyme